MLGVRCPIHGCRAAFSNALLERVSGDGGAEELRLRVGDAQRGELYARRHIDLGVKGAPALVEPAYAMLRDGVRAMGFEVVENAGAGVSALAALPGAGLADSRDVRQVRWAHRPPGR